MKISIFVREKEPVSVGIYREKVSGGLLAHQVEIRPFGDPAHLPDDSDVVWDPGLCGNIAPSLDLVGVGAPLVATVHGAAPFVMRWRDLYPDPLRAIRGKYRTLRAGSAWRSFRSALSAVIAVSDYGAGEISRALCLSPDAITTAHHGVDHDVFNVNGRAERLSRPYLLHVSSYQPKKNIARIIKAYGRAFGRLPAGDRPLLVLIVPGYKDKDPDIEGLTLLRKSQTPQELACWYRGAVAFIFPSLHETFGMPVVEAMACGCPVVTSKVTACEEVAGGAALLVDPWSVDEMAGAMRRFIGEGGEGGEGGGVDEELRGSLREKGLLRAARFTWERSAKEHYGLFCDVLKSRGKGREGAGGAGP